MKLFRRHFKGRPEKGARLCRRPAAARCGQLFGLENRGRLRLVEDDTAALRVFQTCSQQSGFTMVEVAISLAIIGIALVAIIGVLPIGMNVQRDNREVTVINQDATVFLEAISKGSSGVDDLTNYVFAITNFQTQFNPDGTPAGPAVTYGYTNFPSSLTNGANIIGLLSTPEYTDQNTGASIPSLIFGGYSNHIIASVRSLSGPAVEKPPQDNDIIRSDAFSYRIYCVNATLATDTNAFYRYDPWSAKSYSSNAPVIYNWNYWRAVNGTSPADVPGQSILWNREPSYALELSPNLHELRLTFLWPVRPNGKLGNGRQTYRTLVPGQLQRVFQNNLNLYFYQPQSFTAAP